MNCPFCAEEIKDEAFVCKHCRRDLSIARPLLLRLNEHTQQIADLGDKLEELKAAVAGQTPQACTKQDTEPAPDERDKDNQPNPPPASVSAITACLASAFLLLVVAHYLIVWSLDLNIRWLLAATIFIPGLSAARTAAISRIRIPILVLLAAILGIASVSAMVVVAAWGNINNAWPSARSEWVSDISWVLSVALSFLSGALTRRALTGVPVFTTVKGLLDPQGTATVEAQMVHIGRLIEVVTPILTALGAVMAGVRSLLK